MACKFASLGSNSNNKTADKAVSEILSLGKSQYLGEIDYIRDVEGLTASVLTADPLELSNDALHYHENPIISFILQGDSFERINHRTNRRCAGDLRFYRAGDLHQVKIERYPSRNINFELNSGFLSSSGFSEAAIASALEKNSNAKLMLLRTYKEFYANDSFSDSSIMIQLFSLFGEAYANVTPKKPEWIGELRDILNDRWDENLSLAELSCALNVHPVTISKYFTKYFGCTFGEYMRRLRIGKSINLIKSSRLSLTEIALHCGFYDQSHFTRNFKELTGFLPKEYKKL